MTGCEVVVVLSLLTTGGKPSSVKAHAVVPKRCRVTVRFVPAPPVRVCPIQRR